MSCNFYLCSFHANSYESHFFGKNVAGFVVNFWDGLKFGPLICIFFWLEEKFKLWLVVGGAKKMGEELRQFCGGAPLGALPSPSKKKKERREEEQLGDYIRLVWSPDGCRTDFDAFLWCSCLYSHLVPLSLDCNMRLQRNLGTKAKKKMTICLGW